MAWWIGQTKESIAERTAIQAMMARGGEIDSHSHRYWMTQVARVSILEIKLKEYYAKRLDDLLER